jgi:hypothetical protein
MLSKRMQTSLGLLDLACIVALVGMIVMAGVPPARFPPTFRIMEYVIFLCLGLSFLYRLIAHLSPFCFRIKTIMIVVAVVAVQLTLVRVIGQMLGSRADGGPAYLLALLLTPGLVHSCVQEPPAKGLTLGRYATWKLRRFAGRVRARWGGRTRQ